MWPFQGGLLAKPIVVDLVKFVHFSFFFFSSEGKKKMIEAKWWGGAKIWVFVFLSLLLLIIITPENTTITATVNTADGQEDSRLLLFLRWYRYQKHYFSIFCWGCCCHCGCCYVPSPAHPLHHRLQVQAMASFSLFFPLCLSYSHHQGPFFKICLSVVGFDWALSWSDENIVALLLKRLMIMSGGGLESSSFLLWWIKMDFVDVGHLDLLPMKKGCVAILFGDVLRGFFVVWDWGMVNIGLVVCMVFI